MADTTNPNAVAGTPLTRGVITDVAIASGATEIMEVADCAPDDFVRVQVDMTAGAVGDLTVDVYPYEEDGVTVSPVALPAVAGVGYTSTLNGGHDYFDQKYDIQGIDKVRVIITNNNAAGQTITRASWRTKVW